MNYFLTDYFKNQVKPLKKKYPHVKDDLFDVLSTFNRANEISIGRSIYKIRIASRDMNKGKSGGFRSYVFVFVQKNVLVPLCIYAKSETESITENELNFHFVKNLEELVNFY